MLVKTISINTEGLPVKKEEIYGQIFGIVKKRIEERCPITIKENYPTAYIVNFKINDLMESESFKIEDQAGGVTISGRDFVSLIFGAGQFLHKSSFDNEGMYPCEWRGTSKPKATLRAIYFALHFYNWYHRASPEELQNYLIDLMLWGYNTVFFIYPKLNLTGWDDPDVEKMFLLLEKLLIAAKNLNLKTGYMFSNTDFSKTDEKLAADKTNLSVKTGNLICPGTPEGYMYIEDLIRKIVTRISKIRLDYVLVWPYDEGGCCCDNCSPWGGNGFYRWAKRMSVMLREVVPGVKVGLSTWLFAHGTNDARDFTSFYENLKNDFDSGERWVDYILADTSTENFPSYVLRNGSPCGLPLINFPEISMVELRPWGGFGANPVPMRLEKLWRQSEHLLDGGLPYSEGIFDDINKVIISGFYWDGRSYKETLCDYIGFEYSKEVMDDVLKMIELIEKNHTLTMISKRGPADLEIAGAAWDLARKIDGMLPDKAKKSWRWRILYLRPFLDLDRYTEAEKKGWPFKNHTRAERFTFWRDIMSDSNEVREALKELIEIYHAFEVDSPKYFMHAAVRPPLKDK